MARPGFTSRAGLGSGALSGKTPHLGGTGKNNSPKGNTHRTLGKRVG